MTLTNQQILDDVPKGAEDWTHYWEGIYILWNDAAPVLNFVTDCLELGRCHQWCADLDIEDCHTVRSRTDIEELARLECQKKALRQVNAELERENEALKQQLSGITGELEALKAERESHYIKWQEKYAAVKRERDQLATLLPFIDSCIECCFEGLSYDGADIQDHLTELGVLVIEPYDSSKHHYEGWADLEDGDDFYLVVPWLKKQLRKNAGGDL